MLTLIHQHLQATTLFRVEASLFPAGHLCGSFSVDLPRTRPPGDLHRRLLAQLPPGPPVIPQNPARGHWRS